MRCLVATVGALAAVLATTSSAYAVFFTQPVPEPASLGLLAAGGVTIAVARYLRKRRNKRNE